MSINIHQAHKLINTIFGSIPNIVFVESKIYNMVLAGCLKDKLPTSTIDDLNLNHLLKERLTKLIPNNQTAIQGIDAYANKFIAALIDLKERYKELENSDYKIKSEDVYLRMKARDMLLMNRITLGFSNAEPIIKFMIDFAKAQQSS